MAPSSSARRFGGEEALGGLSLSEAGRLAEEEWEVATIVVFRLLKAGPSMVSSSSSEAMSTTPLLLSRGVGGGEALTVARGTTAIGTGEVGVDVSCGEAGAGVACGEAGVGVV